ncbi:SRPBCC family protein [Fictibacillus phosphorivorans]|uniref:SRPBCC family protein n=1 Tax=Fictibacillus phosphorivorans TaxID=1221500 RepID=UPI001293ECF3|nr:SRPBCC domain-containing protein [Fictibacillus phosphorivorans]MQR94378.1 SRPBCC domain-containing protein [Fictibacillus phosphorivorans]
MPEINHKTYIKVTVEDVYHTISTAQGWNAWFTDETSLEIYPDRTGEIRMRWINFGSEKVTIEDGGSILEAIPNQKFVFQWSPGEQISTVTIELKPYKDGTLVVLNESGYTHSERDIRACIGCSVGWGEALALLKVYLEHGIVYKQDLIL